MPYASQQPLSETKLITRPLYPRNVCQTKKSHARQIEFQGPLTVCPPRAAAASTEAQSRWYAFHLISQPASDLPVVLFCGIKFVISAAFGCSAASNLNGSPGVKSSELGLHFGHPNNMFWRCLHESGQLVTATATRGFLTAA